jgi:exonuclease III
LCVAKPRGTQPSPFLLVPWKRYVLNILFWNFNCAEPDPAKFLAQVARQNPIDILVLAESTADSDTVLTRLRADDSRFDRPTETHPRVQFFTRFPGKQLEPFRSDERLDVRRLRLPGHKEVLIAAIHAFDRRNFGDVDSRYSKCHSLRQTVCEAERDAGHCRTILMGDFNMNPFEKGMIDPLIGFGAVLNRDLVIRLSADNDSPPRFYNPMWARSGRPLPEPPGTFYWNKVAEPLNIFWHCLDQVLIRPQLLDNFEDESLQILRSIPLPSEETIDLIRPTRRHWVVQISDHLPILFRLDVPEEGDHA